MLTRRQLLQTTAASGLMSTIPFGASLAADAPVPMKAFLDDLDELVRIDSKSGYAEGVRRVADVMEKRFASHRLDRDAP